MPILTSYEAVAEGPRHHEPSCCAFMSLAKHLKMAWWGVLLWSMVLAASSPSVSHPRHDLACVAALYDMFVKAHPSTFSLITKTAGFPTGFCTCPVNGPPQAQSLHGAQIPRIPRPPEPLGVRQVKGPAWKAISRKDAIQGVSVQGLHAGWHRGAECMRGLCQRHWCSLLLHKGL